jgi:hypothetical protein
MNRYDRLFRIISRTCPKVSYIWGIGGHLVDYRLVVDGKLPRWQYYTVRWMLDWCYRNSVYHDRRKTS